MQKKKKDSDALKEANEKLKETTTLHKKKKGVWGRSPFLLSPVKEKLKFVRMAACSQEVNRNLSFSGRCFCWTGHMETSAVCWDSHFRIYTLYLSQGSQSLVRDRKTENTARSLICLYAFLLITSG